MYKHFIFCDCGKHLPTPATNDVNMNFHVCDNPIKMLTHYQTILVHGCIKTRCLESLNQYRQPVHRFYGINDEELDSSTICNYTAYHFDGLVSEHYLTLHPNAINIYSHIEAITAAMNNPLANRSVKMLRMSMALLKRALQDNETRFCKIALSLIGNNPLLTKYKTLSQDISLASTDPFLHRQTLHHFISTLEALFDHVLGLHLSQPFNHAPASQLTHNTLPMKIT